MQIPKNLPQFENYPVLFLSAGEYNAHFYLALNGKVEEIDSIKMSPRDNAKEKQAFVGRKTGMINLESISHHGAYIEDLKSKFKRKVCQNIHNILATYPKMKEIILFAPSYSANRILEKLNQPEKKKVRMVFYNEYAKTNPLDLIKTFEKESQKMTAKKVSLNPEEKKILRKPSGKPY